MNDLTFPRPNRSTLNASRPRFTDRRLFASERIASALPLSGTPWAKSYRAKLRVTDAAIVVVVVAAAFYVRMGTLDTTSPTAEVSAVEAAFIAFMVIAVWAICLAVFHTRDLTVVGGGVGEYKRVVNASATVFGPVASVILIGQLDSGRWFLVVTIPVGIFGLLLGRWTWRRWLIQQREFGHYLWRVVVVGKRADVEDAVQQIGVRSGSAYSVVGVVLEDTDTDPDDGIFGEVRVMRDLSRVAEYASFIGADGVVVVGQPTGSSDFIHDLAWELEGKTVQLILATSLANVAGPRIHFRPVDGLPLLHVEIPQFEGGKHVVKRAMDVLASGAALLVLWPLFLVLAVAVRADSDGPALFSQERVGRGGRSFTMLKFRSMVDSAPELQEELAATSDGNGVLFKLKHDPRVTRIGRTLRKYSLDELPQLWNVLKGDMSLVGPRPPLPCEVSGYEDRVRRRLFIKPGLTGMWQINGRSDLSWEESVRLDLYYVENWSVVGDLRIIWRTFRVLVNPVGAY